MERRFAVRYGELMAEAEVRPEALEGVLERLAEFVKSLPVESDRIVQHLSWGTAWKEIEHLARKLNVDLIAARRHVVAQRAHRVLGAPFRADVA